jgi:tetratricopeptide (TPR) repeat protein
LTKVERFILFEEFMDILRKEPLAPKHESAQNLYESMVRSNPDNAEAWLRLSYTEKDPRMALEHIQRAVDLKPNDPAIQAGLRHILFDRLQKDPFVEFLAETDKNYVVTLRNSRPVVIPKLREKAEPYPPPRLSEAQRVARLVGLMALGLIPAGLGAFVLAPVVLRRAWKLLRARGLSPRDYRVALVSMALAGGIGLLGEALFGLLLLHWFG